MCCQNVLRQYRTILGTHLACIMFRHIVRKSWPIQEVFPAIFRQSDENSDCAIYAPELCGVALKCSIIGHIRPLEVGMPGFSRFRLKKSQAVPAPLWLPQTADIYFSDIPRLPFRQSFLPAIIPLPILLSSFAVGLICAVHRRRLCRADVVFPSACAHGRRHSSAKSVSRTVCSL